MHVRTYVFVRVWWFFQDAVDVWARTFAALGIDYKGSTMTLDL
jgi:hypothetical protein